MELFFFFITDNQFVTINFARLRFSKFIVDTMNHFSPPQLFFCGKTEEQPTIMSHKNIFKQLPRERKLKKTLYRRALKGYARAQSGIVQKR